jgi:hypothetical protein
MSSRCQRLGRRCESTSRAHLDNTAAIADGDGVLCAPVVKVRAFADCDSDKDGLERCGGPVRTVLNDVNGGRVHKVTDKAGTSTPFLATMSETDFRCFFLERSRRRLVML